MVGVGAVVGLGLVAVVVGLGAVDTVVGAETDDVGVIAAVGDDVAEGDCVAGVGDAECEDVDGVSDAIVVLVVGDDVFGLGEVEFSIIVVPLGATDPILLGLATGDIVRNISPVLGVDPEDTGPGILLF